MGYFPLCVDLKEKTVILVGNGPQIRDKAKKLEPFGPRMLFCENFGNEELVQMPVLVVVGDVPEEQAEPISMLCREHRIPVNVVDIPKLCSFSFPGLITRGDLTISISTGGKSPAAAAYLRGQIEEQIPDKTEEILDWLQEYRSMLRERGVLKQAVSAAFELGRPLTEEEWRAI